MDDAITYKTDANSTVFMLPVDSNVTSGFNTTLTLNWSVPPVSTTESAPPEARYDVWQQVIIIIFLLLLMIGTIVGNSLVCIAVAIVKRLQTPSNLLILSLAVSDLLVALLVMPFAATADIVGHWPLGDIVCDLFTSLDVILCTASILNLCMISVDRYFVITRPFKYAMKRTPRRMALMIAFVWFLSVVISVPPMLGWKPKERGRYECIISQEIGYQIYATLGAFYIPLMAMIFVYYRIWKVSSRLAKKTSISQPGSIDKGHDTLFLPSAKSSRSSGQSDVSSHNANGFLKNGNHETNECDDGSLDMLHHHKNNNHHTRRRFTIKSLLSRTQKSATHKDTRATRTLGVIMGGFTACWLPFFILAVVRPICMQPEVGPCDIPWWLDSLFMWLGYANSFLNPVIYARFNRDFRTPFKEILCLRCRGINNRLRSVIYVEQYGPDPTYRDSLKPTTETTVRYHSQGQTVVHLGNGSVKPDDETRV